jgi:hypothetical protein
MVPAKKTLVRWCSLLLCLYSLPQSSRPLGVQRKKDGYKRNLSSKNVAPNGMQLFWALEVSGKHALFLCWAKSEACAVSSLWVNCVGQLCGSIVWVNCVGLARVL